MNSGRNTLAVDARWLVTGIGTYTLNLLRHLKLVDASMRLRALTTSSNARLLHPLCDELAIVDVPIYTIREQIEVPWASRHSHLLHVPHYNFPLMRRGPLLVTISDITHLLDPQYRASIKTRCYGRPMLRMAAKRADHVFTVSEYSKSQIIEQLEIPSDKITVAHNGVSEEFRPGNRQWASRVVANAMEVRLPYILFVGLLKPHKNIPGLLRAFAWLRSRPRFEHMLLVIGAGSAQAVLQKEADALGIADYVVFRSYVPQHLLVSAYCGADLVVQPSFEEGFGLPVLEAMACGTPVACSRTASLPEVAGDGAAYFDPCSIEDMGCTIERVLLDSQWQQELRIRGLSRSASFTWLRSAQAHYRVYREFLN